MADGPDDRGWASGEMFNAEQMAMVMNGGLPNDTEVAMPKELIAKLDGPTLLFYFSPTCPHCRAVAAEVNALSKRLDGKATVLGIASGSSTLGEIMEFKATYDIDFTILHDTDRNIVSAMGARSTPSALLIAPKSKSKVTVLDVWYPYLPSFDAMVEGRVLGDIYAVFRPNEYKGDNFCGSCHITPAQSWNLTHHSLAWRTLVLKDEDKNPKCTGCHVTGNGQPGGWDGSEDSPMVDVGCEACHGPGGPHDGVRVEPRDTCEGCHDEDHAIAFTYEKGLPLIDHYRAQDMSPEEIHAERVKLYNGEVPRELLAFAAGKNLGASACKSCHEDPYAWWEANGHHGAMGVLETAKPPKADDPTCVRCHATATASGTPPSNMEGFHVDDGVGCESCHGPGEAHVAAGGAPNTIEGLGDDCPVCVIEAVCTGCHTAEWDPGWELKFDLPKVEHTPPAESGKNHP